ncbi:MAG: NADH:ubiquinone reductase (Na(+)-transporting) subunit B [Bacteroidales bacterium]|nr:NADH:ubiquinone reductase (Na(+)-transporting) subunit B [Bacteroidales bacterium]
MGLRKFVDKIKPNFEKGGKLHFLHSTFDAFETFLFVPNTVTKKGSHIRDNIDMKRTMIIVVVSLVPALLFGMWNTGYQYNLSMGITDAGLMQNFWYGFLRILPLLVVSYAVGLGTEFVFAQIRKHEVAEGFLVSGILIPMIVPIDVPLWMVGVATFLAVVFGKEVFGGTGMNIVNPALLTRAILFFAYPSKMSGALVWVNNLGSNPNAVDGYSGATMLGELATATTPDQLTHVQEKFSVMHQIIGNIPGSIGETSVIAIAIGAMILIFTGIGSWKTMFAAFAGGAAIGLLFNAIGANTYMTLPWYEHLFIGGFAFGMVFMITDPVSSAQTETGKWIYGFLAGAIAIIIRVTNPAYPEGVMLSILLMNIFAPLIDFYVVKANINRRLKRAKVAIK